MSANVETMFYVRENPSIRKRKSSLKATRQM